MIELADLQACDEEMIEKWKEKPVRLQRDLRQCGRHHKNKVRIECSEHEHEGMHGGVLVVVVDLLSALGCVGAADVFSLLSSGGGMYGNAFSGLCYR